MFGLVQIYIHKYSIKDEVNEEIMEPFIEQDELVEKDKDKTEIWQIEIPQISLVASISEGVTKEIINKYVGHFENTSRQQGNIALAFSNNNNLKKLKKGDYIKYIYNEFEKIYEIEKCRIIKAAELQYLEDTDENMLTIITFVKSQPEYRRCIQAVEKEEE